MIIPVSTYYLKNQGNTHLNARVRNPLNGQYLIFSTGLFQQLLDETTKVYLLEQSSSDITENLYSAEIDVPVGDYVLELYADTKFLGESDTHSTIIDSRLSNTRASLLDNLINLDLAITDIPNQDLTTIETAIGNIPTNPLLANDIRLNNLDASISSRLSAFEILSESYAADGSNATLSQILYMIWGMLSEKAKTGDTTISTKRLDTGEVSMTFTLDNGVAPTSITRAT